MAYAFEPHGLVFSTAVRAEQTLRNTIAASRTDFSRDRRGYFSVKEDIDWGTRTATVNELQPVELIQELTGKKIKFRIDHFSGYLLGVS